MKLAYELMLGSYIKHIDKIVECNLNTIYAVMNAVDPTVLYSPIELTDKLLPDLGFYVRNDYSKKYMWIEDFGVETSDGFVYYEDGYGFRSKIETVHRLQLLYFSLEQKHLKLKK